MRTSRRYAGQALIPVLFAMLALTALAVTISMTVHRSTRAAANYSINNQRFFAAQGAMYYAMAALAQSSNNGDTYGIVQPDPSTDANGWWKIGHCWVKIEVAPTGMAMNLNSVTLSQLEELPVFQTNPTLAQAIIDWRTPTADSLTGIANQENGSSGGSGTGSTTAGAAGGASSASQQPSTEGQYYTQLPQPYSPIGAGFDSVRELLLVEGMTPTILYSTPAGQIAPLPSAAGANGTGIGSSASQVGAMMTRQAAAPGGSAAAGGGTGGGTGGAAATSASSTAAQQFASIYEESTLPLSELFTTVSRSLNVTSTGLARVNVNTATAAAMEQAGISARYANAIVTYRNQQRNGQSANTGGAAAGGGRPRPGGARPGAGGPRPGFIPGGGAVRPRAAAAAPIVGAAGSGGAQGATTTAGIAGATGGGAGGTTATTAVFSSIGDLLKVGGINAQAMQQIADLVTTTNNPYLENVVDLNTAPQEVLAMVPGMDTTLLDAIMQYRQTGQAFQTMDDFFSLSGVSNATFEATAGSLTAKCSTYRIRILVRTEDSQQTYAVSSIVEITANGPQVLQWRRVQRAPGWTQWGAPPAQLPPPTSSTSSSQTSASGLQ